MDVERKKNNNLAGIFFSLFNGAPSSILIKNLQNSLLLFCNIYENYVLYQFMIFVSKYTDVVKKEKLLLSSTLKSALVRVSGGLIFVGTPFTLKSKKFETKNTLKF